MVNILENIFSVSDENNHKLIKIFGIKAKFYNYLENCGELPDRYFGIINKYRFEDFFHLHHHLFDYLIMYNPDWTENIINYLNNMELIGFSLGLKPVIPVMDFNITTRCTLRCKECGSMMPFYSNEQQYTIDFKQFKKDLDKLLGCVRKIYKIKLIGGEPLLVKDLEKMLEYACKKRKILRVEITTNGTIIPSDKLLEIAKKYRRKCSFNVSNYSSNKELKNLHCNEVIEKLEENNIFHIHSDYTWQRRGFIIKQNRCKNDIKRCFEKCWQNWCTSVLDGKFYLCTRAAAIHRLAGYNFMQDEFIDIRKESVKKARKKIIEFYRKDYFSVCDFCEECFHVKVPRAEQTKETFIIGRKYDDK